MSGFWRKGVRPFKAQKRNSNIAFIKTERMAEAWDQNLPSRVERIQPIGMTSPKTCGNGAACLQWY
jgi:hypothetical protein